MLVGVWNTAFGYGTFVLFAYWLSKPWPRYGYIPGGVLSSILSITVAFFAYKRFIFKTEGNYFKEWLRCLAVYSSSIVIGSAILPGMVFVVRHFTSIDKNAPYVAAALLSGFNVVYNFLGNKKFSFKTPTAQPDPPSPPML